MTTKFYKTAIICVIGGYIYCLIELLWRGYTHWSMLVVGAIMSLSLDKTNERLGWRAPLWLQMIYGGIGITIVELIAGLILNVWLGLNVWDYSNYAFNFMGQICLLYGILWVFLAGLGIVLFDVLRWKLFGEEKPRYRFRF